MDLQDAIRTRRMVRTFDPARPVPAEALDRILRNGTRAPSAGFSQGQAWLVLQGADLEKFWIYGSDAVGPTVRTAPLVLVPFSCKRAYLDRYAQPDKGWTDRDEARWPVPFWHIDTGMAALLILQTVTDAGLGACSFGIPPERVAAVRDAFGIPETFDPIGAITIGHRTTTDGLPGSPSVRPRKAQADVVHRGRWT